MKNTPSMASLQDEIQILRAKLYDDVTRLPNRTLFFDRLEQAIMRAKREISVLGLLVLDVTTLQDKALLKTIADSLTNCVRETDSTAYLGGDEFAIILAGISKYEDAASISEKIIAALAEIQSHGNRIDISIGIGLYPIDGNSLEKLFSNTSVATDASKQNGNNNSTYFSSISGY